MPDYKAMRAEGRSIGRRRGKAIAQIEENKRRQDRKDQMEQRFRELADNKAAQQNELAKSQYAQAQAGKAAEDKLMATAVANGTMEQDGTYTKKHWETKAYDKYFKHKRTLEETKWYEMNKDKLAAAESSGASQGYTRTYIDNIAAENYKRKLAYNEAVREREGSRQFHGDGVDGAIGRLADSVGDAIFGKREQIEHPTSPELLTQSQGKQFGTNEVTEGTLEFASGSSGFQNIKDVQSGRWLNGTQVDDVVSAEYVDSRGVTKTVDGVMRDNQFVPLPELTGQKPQGTQGASDPYGSDRNRKKADASQQVLFSTTQADRLMDDIISNYNSVDYGSEAVYKGVENYAYAFSTLARPGYDGGIAKKREIYTAMQKGAAFSELPPELQYAIRSNDNNLIQKYAEDMNTTEIGNLTDVMSAQAMTEDEKEIASNLRRAKVPAILQPLVRSLLRSWTGGEKKVAWGAAERLLDTLSVSSNAEGLIGQLDVFSKDMRILSQKELSNKFDASIYSMSNDLDRGFLPMDIGDISKKEYRRNPTTGALALVITGTDADNKPYQYVLDSNSTQVLEVPLPTKADKGSPRDERKRLVAARYLEEYSQQVNEYGNIIQ
tara:strand:+ start:733 stop:2553 length:1821 start_codon:yes stop_codon:yes gene_type:complete